VQYPYLCAYQSECNTQNNSSRIDHEGLVCITCGAHAEAQKLGRLSRDLSEELVDLLVNKIMDLVGKLLGLGAKGLSTLDDLAADNLDILLDDDLELLQSRRRALNLVATGLDDLGKVAAATTVPGEQVGGVGIGETGQGTLGGNRDEALLQLVGGDGSDGELGVTRRLERQVVGQETSDMGRGHGGTRDGVDGVWGADPGGLNADTRAEDVSALSVVGEVSTVIIQVRGADGEGLLSGGRGVAASIGVVVTGSDSEVNTSIDSSVDSSVESSGLATAEGHVGDRALEALALAILGILDGLLVGFGGGIDTLDNIRHAAGTVGAKDLDGVDVGLLGHTVLLASNGAGAVGSVTVAILIGIAIGDSEAPVSAALEVNMVNVGTSVNDVGIYTLAGLLSVEVLVEGAEAEGVTVGDTGKTPRSLLLSLTIAFVLGNGLSDIDGEHSVDEGVLLDVLDIRVVAELLNHVGMEVTSVALESTADREGVLQTAKDLADQRGVAALAELEVVILATLVDLLDPGVVVGSRGVIDVVLELDDVRVRDVLRINAAQNRSSIAVDGLCAERASRGDGRQRESCEALHSDGLIRISRSTGDADRYWKGKGCSLKAH